jgi:replicative DNA helicase
MLRRLIATCSEIASMAYGDCASVADFLAEARARISGIELADTAGPTTIGAELGPAMNSIENRAQQPDAYFLRTGLASFDDLIGGLRGGNLITIAARPGQGKSAWALDILLHAAETLRVPALLFSYEMTKLEIVERSLAKRASINGRSIILGQLEHDEWKKIQATAATLHEIPLWLDTKQTRGEKKLAVVCVDYIGLVESTHAEENRALEISKMTRALKLLAAELEIPVIAISQLNRESAKAQRKPMISDLRDSGAIEQDSNTVLFPYWEGMSPATGRHQAQIIVGKNRGGPVGEVDVDWEPEFVRFSEPLRHYAPPPMRGEKRFPDAENV